MPSQYRRGRSFEYATRDHLREHGYEVVRSAGSKTKIDLIGIKPGELLFIQCKLPNSHVSGAEWNRLFELAQQVGAHALIAAKLPGRVAPEYRLITTPVVHPGRREYQLWRPDGASPSA